jgi:hypothetical protein
MVVQGRAIYIPKCLTCRILIDGRPAAASQILLILKSKSIDISKYVSKSDEILRRKLG